jgi:hypothetical protein
MGGAFVEVFLIAWVVDLIEPEDLFLVVLALDCYGRGVVLGEAAVLPECPPYRTSGNSENRLLCAVEPEL